MLLRSWRRTGIEQALAVHLGLLRFDRGDILERRPKLTAVDNAALEIIIVTLIGQMDELWDAVGDSNKYYWPMMLQPTALAPQRN